MKMSKIKRIAAVFLTLAMVMGMSITAFADFAKPVDGDAKVVEVKGIEENVTYNAYQIIDAEYDANGFTGYVWAPGINENDSIQEGKKVEFSPEGENAVVTGLDEAFITKLVADPSKLTNCKIGFNPSETPLEAGTWMILVTPTETNPEKVYNPMIVSVYYSVKGSGDSNELVSGTIDATKDWELEATDSFAKSSDISLEKDLDDEPNDTEVAVGDIVPFTITSTIPSYSPEYYKSPTFQITDTLVNGLKYNGEPEVYLGGIEEGNKLSKDVHYTLEYDVNTHFTIKFNFNNDTIKNLYSKTAEARAVTVKYETEILDSAVQKVGENTATLTYSKNTTETGTKTDKEYVFSFALHNVFQKVDGSNKPLGEAVFTLYKEDAASKDTIKWAEDNEVNVSEVTTYTTKDAENGDIKFKGLDGDLTYYVKETAAPEGYSINDTIYKVVFTFDKPEGYTGDDVEYTVTITNNKTDETKTYTVKYNGTTAESEAGEYGNAPKTGSDEVTTVINTKLSALPSTGGIGTTIFTIAGCLIMIAAAGLFFVSRRKSAK